MRIRWLPAALMDLDRIDEFWRCIDITAAERAAEIIYRLVENLDQFPDRGRVSRVDPITRELVARFGAGAFILRYRIDETEVLIVQVKHSREDSTNS